MHICAVDSSNGSPYCFAHLAAGSQSSLGVKSSTLPRSGTGVGPGGNDAPLWRRWMAMRRWMRVQSRYVLRISTTNVAGEDRRKEEEYALDAVAMLYAVWQRMLGLRNASVGGYGCGWIGWKGSG